MDLEGLVKLYLADPPINQFGGSTGVSAVASREPMVVYEIGGDALKLRVPGGRPVDAILAAMGDTALRDCDAFGAVFEAMVMLGDHPIDFDMNTKFDPRIRVAVVAMMFDADGVHYGSAFQGINDDGSDGAWDLVPITECSHTPDEQQSRRMIGLWLTRQDRPPRMLRRQLP